MSLAAGVRLGPYEIVAPLGAGGMGEVYKARDTRLGRTVAIKILPEHAASDPERLRRFGQEARAASALNHPHICVLHDIGESVLPNSVPVHYLVLEHLEGQTLAQRLRTGALPLAQALDLAAEIADALAAAHRHGIVHRDLKPGNIMLVKDGGALHAKLLDFGLAKLTPRAGGSEGGASTHSAAPLATSPGTLMGTVPYMAPEQLEGKATDARTDLFAFGCVLYEMLTGRRAFAGDSEASLVSAIMTSEPAPIAAAQPRATPALERLVKGCLAKDPDARRESAHDVAEELRSIARGPELLAARRVSPPRNRRAWVGAVSLLGAVAAIAVAVRVLPAWWNPRSVWTEIVIPWDADFVADETNQLAFAPDGSGLVYRAFAKDQHRLYWQTLDGSAPAQVIPGTDGASQPFFSPDGRFLAFFRELKVMKMTLSAGSAARGGPAEPLAEVGRTRGMSWGDDGTILHTRGPYSGLWRMSANGSDARELTKPDPARNELSHRWPAFLPGARAALFTVFDVSQRQDRSAIAVLSLDDGTWRRIIERASYARYLPSGHVVFARNGSLLAVRFDMESLSPVGEPAPVINGVLMQASQGSGTAHFDVSRSGSLVFARPGGPSTGSLVWVDRQGRVEPVTGESRAYKSAVALSRDGQKLAVSINGPEFENLWVYHLREKRWQQFVAQADEEYPLWSPSGDQLAFASNRDGAFNVYVARSDGDGRPERLTSSPSPQYPISWSPDGRFIAYQEGYEIWILPLDGDRKPWRWGPETSGRPYPAFSPDGRWLAYQSLETGGDPFVGNASVHVRPFPGPGARQTVSGTEGGLKPMWSPDGRELLFIPASNGYTDNRILAVDVSPGPPLRFSDPHVAFALPIAASPFALGHDGRRLVMVRLDEGRPPTELRSLMLVRNWMAEVKEKLAAAK